MNLTDLGFHKCAGAQADLYRLVKPTITKSLSARTKKDALNLMNEFNLPDDINEQMLNVGVFKSLLGAGEKNLAAKVTRKGMDQIAGKLGRYPHNIDPAVYPIPVGRATDIRGANGRPLNSWLHLRGIDPNAASKSGDRRRGF